MVFLNYLYIENTQVYPNWREYAATAKAERTRESKVDGNYYFPFFNPLTFLKGLSVNCRVAGGTVLTGAGVLWLVSSFSVYAEGTHSGLIIGALSIIKFSQLLKKIKVVSPQVSGFFSRRGF
ncbi:hypothetical protein [Mucilaginibacter sp.]|uniref:hypothetical protein n=1 Tax=Mucilaginibacter sp. TaxID=1882438 RepID=UPI0035691B37